MPAGRPTVRSPEIESKLEYALAIGGTILDACFYAGIGETTYHRWASEDEEFRERMTGLRRRPVLKALETVNQDLENPLTAKWYLERRHEDFKPKQAVEQSGSVGVGLSDAAERVLDRLLSRAEDGA